jgi:hypothetical protein
VELPENGIPATYCLEQNFPNPFNPSTTIRYSLLDAGRVTLTVTDLLGRTVAVLVNEWKAPGSYSAKFSAAGLASGVYFYRVWVGGYVGTRKMLLIR